VPHNSKRRGLKGREFKPGGFGVYTKRGFHMRRFGFFSVLLSISLLPQAVFSQNPSQGGGATDCFTAWERREAEISDAFKQCGLDVSDEIDWLSNRIHEYCFRQYPYLGDDFMTCLEERFGPLRERHQLALNVCQENKDRSLRESDRLYDRCMSVC
jgi:hypothetical protein